MIPNILTQKPKMIADNEKATLRPALEISKSIVSKSTNSLTLDYSDEDSDNDENTDFFSINKTHELPDLPVDVELDIDKSSQPNQQPHFKEDVAANGLEITTNIAGHSNDAQDYEMSGHAVDNTSSVSEVQLDDEAVSYYLTD